MHFPQCHIILGMWYLTTLRCVIVIHRILRINIQYQKFYLQIILDKKSILQWPISLMEKCRRLEHVKQCWTTLWLSKGHWISWKPTCTNYPSVLSCSANCAPYSKRTSCAMGHQGAPVNSTFVTNVSVSIREVRAVEGYLRFQKATIATDAS